MADAVWRLLRKSGRKEELHATVQGTASGHCDLFRDARK